MRQLPLLTVLVLFLVPFEVSAQGWPPEIKNLKVLPADKPAGEVIAAMRGFTMALGVRCQHCHVGEEGQRINEFDFASDEKPAKEIARSMLRMTAAINEGHLSKLDLPAGLEVQCVTCHRGTTQPEQLSALVLRTAVDDGIDSAISKYQELRLEYYGSGSYDFSESALVQSGEALLEQGRFKEAARILELNLEHHPESNWTAGTLASAYEQSDRKADALAIWKRMLEKQPDDARIKSEIKRLETSG